MVKKRQLKQFVEYVEGDDSLRKTVFKEKIASQQVIFDLFSQLDHVHYNFFMLLASVPNDGFWSLILSQLSAVAAGAAKNRNFCENYGSLPVVEELESPYAINKEKIINLVGASHGLWFELADPNYSQKPNTHEIWTSLYNVNPCRTTWEWWFEARCAELLSLEQTWADKLGKDPYAEIVYEEWVETKLGLHFPRTHGYLLVKEILDTFKQATLVKHKIASPYFRLVYTVTRKIAAYNQPDQFTDTYDYGCCGLMRAIAKYAPSMSMAFFRFAEKEIYYEICYQLGNYNVVTLPHKSWQKYRDFDAFRKEYIKRTGKEPSVDEIAEHFEINTHEVLEIYFQILMQNPCSLEQKVYAEESSQAVTLKDKIEDPLEKESQQLFEDQEVLLLALSRMSLRERKLFVVVNNLCDVVQDIEPDHEELTKFFQTV